MKRKILNIFLVLLLGCNSSVFAHERLNTINKVEADNVTRPALVFLAKSGNDSDGQKSVNVTIKSPNSGDSQKMSLGELVGIIAGVIAAIPVFKKLLVGLGESGVRFAKGSSYLVAGIKEMVSANANLAEAKKNLEKAITAGNNDEIIEWDVKVEEAENLRTKGLLKINGAQAELGKAMWGTLDALAGQDAQTLVQTIQTLTPLIPDKDTKTALQKVGGQLTQMQQDAMEKKPEAQAKWDDIENGVKDVLAGIKSKDKAIKYLKEYAKDRHQQLTPKEDALVKDIKESQGAKILFKGQNIFPDHPDWKEIHKKKQEFIKEVKDTPPDKIEDGFKSFFKEKYAKLVDDKFISINDLVFEYTSSLEDSKGFLTLVENPDDVKSVKFTMTDEQWLEYIGQDLT